MKISPHVTNWSQKLIVSEAKSFWLDLCPGFEISNSPFDRSLEPFDVDAEFACSATEQVSREGYFGPFAAVPLEDCREILHLVRNVVEAGYPAPFVLVYDKVWQVLWRLRKLLEPMLGAGCHITRDVWVYYIRPPSEAPSVVKETSGWPPHRDGGAEVRSLRKDGRPKLLNIWLPFADVAPDQACMYVLPTDLDPHFPDQLHRTEVPALDLASVRALPASAGEMMGWNEYALHWGSRMSAHATSPRISLTARLQSNDWPPHDISILREDSQFDFSDRLGVVASVIHRYRRRLAYPTELQEYCDRKAKLYKAVEMFRAGGVKSIPLHDPTTSDCRG